MVETGQDIGIETEPYYAGDALQIVSTVFDGGVERNLENDEVEFRLETRLNKNVILDDDETGVSATVSDAASGEITVRIDGGVTTGMEGRYRYRIRVIDDSGSPATVTVGRFKIS
jgi:hypothetical protein